MGFKARGAEVVATIGLELAGTVPLFDAVLIALGGGSGHIPALDQQGGDGQQHYGIGGEDRGSGIRAERAAARRRSGGEGDGSARD